MSKKKTSTNQTFNVEFRKMHGDGQRCKARCGKVDHNRRVHFELEIARVLNLGAQTERVGVQREERVKHL